MAKPPGDHIPLGGFVLTCGSTPMANKRPDYDAVFERRAKGRTTINRDALLFFEGRNEVHACFVRDVTNEGAGMRLRAEFSILPHKFGISFDGFRTMHKCRLIWRDGDFLGAAFES